MQKLATFALFDEAVLVDTGVPLRRPDRHSDEALTGTTRTWLRMLPAGRRPTQLCTQIPRLANLLAWHWRDPVLSHKLLEDLLTDRRGGRAGFPKAIAFELRRLHDFTEHHGGADSDRDSGWRHGTLESLRRFWSRH